MRFWDNLNEVSLKKGMNVACLNDMFNENQIRSLKRATNKIHSVDVVSRKLNVDPLFLLKFQGDISRLCTI